MFCIILLVSITSVNAIDADNDVENNYTNNSQNILLENLSFNNVSNSNYFYDDSLDNIDEIVDIDEMNTENNQVNSNHPHKVISSQPKDNITINMPDYTGYAGKIINIKATVKTIGGNDVTSAKAAFKINGKTQAHLNVTNGMLTYNFTIPQWSAKNYNITIVVGETSTTNTLRLNRTLSLYKLNASIKVPHLIFLQNDKVNQINATVKDQFDRNVYTGKLAIKINNKTIGHCNTTNGIISYDFTPQYKVGTHNLTIIYGENTFFNFNETNIKVRIINSTIHYYTYNELIEAANRVKNYKIKYNSLPKAVVINNNNNVSMVDFLYLMCQSLNSNDSLSEGYFNEPTVVKENITTGRIYKEEYLKFSKTISNYIAQNGAAQGYIQTSIGTMMFNSTVDQYSRVLAFVYNNNRLPNYISFNQSVYPVPTNPINTTDPYLLPSKNCQSDNSVIINLANQLTSGCTSVLSKATKIFEYVQKNISYEKYSNTKYGAIGTLNKKKGNCCDQTHLLVALLRAVNIKAGYAHANACQFKNFVMGHVWAKIYINGKWMDADPTSIMNSIGNTQSNKIITMDFNLKSQLNF